MTAPRKGGGVERRRPFRIPLGLAAILLLSTPLSVLATLLLLPFWSWLETATGIEAVGHSGPAEWCYLLTFAVLVSAAMVVYRSRKRAAKWADAVERRARP